MGETNYVFITAGRTGIAECFDGAVGKMAAHRPVLLGAYVVPGLFANNHVFIWP